MLKVLFNEFEKAKLQPRKRRIQAKVIVKFILRARAGLEALGKGTAAASRLGWWVRVECHGVWDTASLGISSPFCVTPLHPLPSPHPHPVPWSPNSPHKAGVTFTSPENRQSILPRFGVHGPCAFCLPR